MAQLTPSTWHDGDSARRLWQDAPADDELLDTLLIVAAEQVAAFAPEWHDAAGNVVPIPQDQVPARYRQAQLMQMRNVYNAAKTDPQIAGDGEMFVIRPYPMDNFIKNIIRPKRGTPWVA